LKIGGGCGPSDEPFVKKLRERLQANGVLVDAEFFPNLTKTEKQNFLKSLTIFSVPAPYGEAFGLYVVEALASGIPVVQPRHAAFPELVEATSGGVLFEPNNSVALADAIGDLLLHPEKARAMGETGRKTVFEKFGVQQMAEGMARAFQDSIQAR
jgi:glycosyltransferase involved in cell wall biosynthesis